MDGSVKKSRKFPKVWRLAIESLPLAGAIGASLLPLQRVGQQFLMLVVLIWLQVFFLIECLLANK